MSSHTAFEELAAGYALDALEPADEESFLAHLASCASCQEDVAEHRGAASQLAYAAESLAPPPALRAAIGDAARASTRGQLRTPSGVTTLESRRRRSVTLPVGWLGLAAAAAGVLVLGGVTVGLLGSLDHQRSTLRSRDAALTALAQPDARLVQLGSSGAASGTAVVENGHVFLVVHDLPRNDARTSTYVLWAGASDGRMRAVNRFDVSSDGLAMVDAGNLPNGLSNPTVFAVSHEAGRAIPSAPSRAVLGTRTG